MAGLLRNLIRLITLTAVLLMSGSSLLQVNAAVIPVTYGDGTTTIAAAPDLALNEFVAALDSDVDTLKGIYLEDKFALRIVQQPAGQAGFVSSTQGVVTQFAPAADYGVIGLLAHNFLSGSNFYEVNVGDVITIANGDSEIQQFKVSSVHTFQALSPNNTSSRFVNQATSEEISATQLFQKMYQGDPHLVLQTCIAKDGEPSWGRLFVIAEPVEDLN